MLCKDCGFERERIAHLSPAYKRKHVYKDEKGKLWNGHQCPDCKTPKVVKLNKSKRLCRKCNNLLPSTAYFYHEMCKPEVDIAEGFELV